MALFGKGIGLLSVPPRPYEKKCEGENIDANGECRYLFDMHWVGASLAVIGAVATTIGVVFLIRHKKMKLKLQAQLGWTHLGVRGQF